MDIIHEENISVIFMDVSMDIFISAYPWGPLPKTSQHSKCPLERWRSARATTCATRYTASRLSKSPADSAVFVLPNDSDLLWSPDVTSGFEDDSLDRSLSLDDGLFTLRIAASSESVNPSDPLQLVNRYLILEN